MFAVKYFVLAVFFLRKRCYNPASTKFQET